MNFKDLTIDGNMPLELTAHADGAHFITIGAHWDELSVDNPTLTIEWSLPLIDIQYEWYPTCGFNRSLHVDWYAPVTSKISSSAPVYCFYNAAGRNRFTMALSDVKTLLGCSLGVLMARKQHGFWDKLGTGYIVFINAVPPIVYYLLIQISVTAATPLPMLFNAKKPLSYILPLICMALGPTANYAMWIRRYMVDELNRDYIKLARAKGMPNNKIMRRHVMRNAFIPLAQYLPSTILFTISGSIYVEALFSIPGMGGLLINAIQKQDNPVVQAVVLLYAIMGVFGLLLGDIAMAICDPRISLDKKGGSR